MTFRSLRREEIEAGLAESGWLMLAGEAPQPQSLESIYGTAIGFGVADYPAAAMSDALHRSWGDSCHYVIRGMVEIRDLASGALQRFRAGDFYVPPAGARFVSRVKQNTRVLFAVHPSRVAAEPEPLDAQARAWAEERLRADRVDHAGASAPPANSMIPGASAAVTDDTGRLLMIRRRDSGNWTMPGGAMEIDDSLASCVRREVLEETAIAVEVMSIIGTYSDPRTVVAYSDGEARREFTILFHCKPVSGRLSIDDESTEGCWVSLDEVFDLQLAPSQRRRIEDVIRFVQHGSVAIR